MSIRKISALGAGVFATLFIYALVPPASTAADGGGHYDVGAEPVAELQLTELGPDGSALAAALGLSEGEVQRQISVQTAMDRLDFPTLDPGYAEDGSRMGEPFVVWYRSATKAPPAALLQAMRNEGIDPSTVDFQLVPLSQVDLLNLSRTLAASLASKGIPVGVTLDSATGGVMLHPDSADIAVDSRRAAEELSAQLDLATQWGDPPPDPGNYGGKNANFTTAGANCTAGFTVSVDGNRRMSSAGHCPDAVGEAVTHGGEGGFEVTRREYNTLSDVAYYDKSGESWTNKVKYADDGSTRDVTGVQAWANMDVGDPVSKYGRTTGYTIGEIVDRTSCSPAGCNPDARFVRVERNGGGDMCDQGDSGGPTMYNLTAYGLTSGFTPTGTAFTWRPVNYPGQS